MGGGIQITKHNILVDSILLWYDTASLHKLLLRFLRHHWPNDATSYPKRMEMTAVKTWSYSKMTHFSFLVYRIMYRTSFKTSTTCHDELPQECCVQNTKVNVMHSTLYFKKKTKQSVVFVFQEEKCCSWNTNTTGWIKFSLKWFVNLRIPINMQRFKKVSRIR